MDISYDSGQFQEILAKMKRLVNSFPKVSIEFTSKRRIRRNFDEISSGVEDIWSRINSESFSIRRDSDSLSEVDGIILGYSDIQIEIQQIIENYKDFKGRFWTNLRVDLQELYEKYDSIIYILKKKSGKLEDYSDLDYSRSDQEIISIVSQFPPSVKLT